MIRARLRSAQGGHEGGAPALGKGGAVPGRQLLRGMSQVKSLGRACEVVGRAEK